MDERPYAEYRLSSSDLLLCAAAGAMRRVEDMRKGRKELPGTPTEGGWNRDVLGCIGEWVMSQHLGVPWHGKGFIRGPDVGVAEQVRCSGDLNHRNMVMYESDADDVRFWSVCGTGFVWRVHGWLWGRDGKLEAYWANKGDPKRPPCYWVPHSVLNSPLVDIRKERAA